MSEVPLPDECYRIVAVSQVRSGQPRPYADREDVYRVEFLWRNTLSGEVQPDVRNNRDQQIEAAIHAVGLAGVQRGKPNMNDINAYFRGWMEYAKVVDPGVVEIFVRTPFND